MSRSLLATLALLACLLAPAATRADERILGFDSQLAIRADGSLDVTETIRVRAEGTEIRRGIYRDFPTRYKDRYGNSVVVDFQLLSVLRDGRPEPNFTERRVNGVRINTGNDDFLPTPGEFTYTLRYRTKRQLGFFPDHDELYWNVTGTGWSFPMDSVQATVSLPTTAPASGLKLDAYTGRSGEQGRDFQAVSETAGTALFKTTRPLAPGENLTIAIGFPKGLVAEPTAQQRWRWFLRDNRGVLVGLAALVLLVLFYSWRWLRAGRDPNAGPIFPRYEPPADFGPGELRMMRRMGKDQLCFAADLVDMGVRGFVQIHQGKKKEGWRVVREPGADTGRLTASQRALATSLFKDGDEIALKNSEAARVGGALAAHAAEMSRRLKPTYFKTNSGSLVIGVIFSMLTSAVAFVVSGDNGIPVLIALGLLGMVVHVVFAWLLKAPTRDGRKLLDEIEGLRMYLGVAERDELKMLRGPGQPPTLDARRYETLLPYAMALEVEQAWTRQFVDAVGAAAAQQASPGWYHSTGTIGNMSLASLGTSLGSALTQQIASSATPPGSSSGGGGGFSGGGGGGGGGGGR